MGAKHFKDLDCWQLANELKKAAVAFTAKAPASRDFDFCNDIRASSRSATSNISEGFGRFTHRDFAHFLTIAAGSLNETENHLQDAFDSNYLSQEEHARLTVLAIRAAKATSALRSYLLKSPSDRPRRRT
jgi:four helix bundle protein